MVSAKYEELFIKFNQRLDEYEEEKQRRFEEKGYNPFIKLNANTANRLTLLLQEPNEREGKFGPQYVFSVLQNDERCDLTSNINSSLSRLLFQQLAYMADGEEDKRDLIIVKTGTGRTTQYSVEVDIPPATKKK